MRSRHRLFRAVDPIVETLEARRLLAASVVADPLFGDDGLAGFAPEVRGTYVLAAPLAGGKILAVGYQARPDDSLAMVAHYNDDGTLDTSFSGDGVATAFVCSRIGDALVQPDGKVVVGGELLDENMFVARFNADGTPDTSFGNSGMTTIAWSQPNFVRGELWGLALAPDGKIVLAGSVQSAQNINGEADRSDIGTARLNTNGTPDTTFGNAGTGEHSLSGWDFATAIAVQPDGKIIVGGFADGTEEKGLVIRYQPNGQTDTSFAENGILKLEFNAEVEHDQVTALSLLSDGSMFIGGGFEFSPTVIIQHVMSDGTIDAQFGAGSGSYLRGGTYAPMDMTVDSAGRIVFVAYSDINNPGHDATRLLPNGLPDTAFSTDGRAFVRGDVPRGINVDASDRVLIGQDMGLLRLAPRPDVALSSSGKLYLTGGDGNDTVSVDVGGGNARVVRNGVTTLYPSGDVTSVDLIAADGDDVISIALDVPVTADLGDGSDSLTIAATTPVTNDQIKHLIDAADGNDTVTVGAGIPLRLDGGAGNDVLTVHGKVLESLFGGEGDDTITSTGSDAVVVFSGPGNDWIATGAGDDYFWADSGNDTISAGAGNDLINMGTGSDCVLAGAGDDHVSNMPFHWSDPQFETGDHDYIDLGAGKHDVNLYGYRLTIVGGPEADKIVAKTKKGLVIESGGGNDHVIAETSATVSGGDGADRLDMRAGGVANGDDGNDDLTSYGAATLYGGAGDDRIETFDDNDVVIHGGDGHDWIRNWAGRSSIYGEGGYDTIWGGYQSDLISGGGGKDRIDGREGNDRIYGGANNDQLMGNYGRDRIFGQAGDDKLFGWSHNDTLDGGGGYDWICGGKGQDMIYARDGETDWLDGGRDDDAAQMDDLDGMVSILTIVE